jgi:phenylalanyl-tRNA synthetase beta chain
MLVSLAWLSRHVDLDGIDVDDLARRFTLRVAELEGVIRHDTAAEVVLGRVREAKEIPGTKLRLCQVDTGDRVRPIVCGAANVRADQLVVVALPGTRLGDRPIEVRQIQGVTSEGMICSEVELGISDEASGILVVDEPLPVGTRSSPSLPLADVVFEIDNKSLTNRPDLWGHRGIAREVAALLGRPLRPMDLDVQLGTGQPYKIAIEDQTRCRRYIAVAIEGVKVARSPLWLRLLLQRTGVRPLSNIVDATNFVMQDIGNPVHAFDRGKLQGSTIHIRNARASEAVRTLDGVERRLSDEDLVIADEVRPIGMAGIVGGYDSRIDDNTTDVVLECPNFAPAAVRLMSQRHNLRTDASARFEKDLDVTLLDLALPVFVKTLQVLSPGARVQSGIMSGGNAHPAPVVIDLRVERVQRRLGVEIGAPQIIEHLRGLEFGVEVQSAELLRVTVPPFRATKDIRQEIDLIEEVGRCHGYNNIPPRPPTVVLARPHPNRRKQLEKRIRGYLAQAGGLDEVLTYSFTSDPLLRRLGIAPDKRRVSLRNPISDEMKSLRTELATNLLGVVDRNAAFPTMGVFEIGRVFTRAQAGELPDQPTHLGAIITDGRLREDPAAGLFSRLSALLQGLALAMERSPLIVTQGGVDHPWVHPVRQATVAVQGTPLGYLAELHPSIAGRLEGRPGAALAEVNLDAWFALAPTERIAEALPRFPPALRDLAVVVSDQTPAAQLQAAIAGASPFIDGVAFQSIYRGEGVPPGSKCLAWSVSLRHADRTLTDKEVREAEQRIWSAIAEKTGGRQR